MSADRDRTEGDFIGRWSRLKRERATAPEVADAPSGPTPDITQAAPGPETTAPAQKSDAEILAEFGLPDPKTLTAGDDFAGFMAKAVPEHLRRVALRRLWASKPIFALNDGLTDYADDYTYAAVAVGKLSTSYTVGRGFMTEEEILPPRGHPDHVGELATAPSAPTDADGVGAKGAPEPDGGSSGTADRGAAAGAGNAAELGEEATDVAAVAGDTAETEIAPEPAVSGGGNDQVAGAQHRHAFAGGAADIGSGGPHAPFRGRMRFRLTDS